MNPKTIWAKSPAVILGIAAAVVLAVVQTLVGKEVLTADAGTFVANALDPEGGWFYPIALGVVTRFFVYSPNSVEQIAAEAADSGSAVVTQGPP